jgi:hypothetical protein
MSLYERLKAAGVPLDNHESDLYVLETPESRKIVQAWQKEQRPRVVSVATFVSNLDGKVWLDIPFMYEPFWDARRAQLP